MEYLCKIEIGVYFVEIDNNNLFCVVKFIILIELNNRVGLKDSKVVRVKLSMFKLSVRWRKE